jgi:hypothetical protein
MDQSYLFVVEERRRGGFGVRRGGFGVRRADQCVRHKMPGHGKLRRG